MDVSDSAPGSDSDASPAKGSRKTLRGNSSKSKAAAAPARRQPSRTAAAKVSLAEAHSDSILDTSSSDEADKGSNRKRTGLSSDKAAVKRQKAVVEDSDCSMGDSANTHKELGLVSDSEAVSDEESDKENRPASPQAAAVKYVSQPLLNLTALLQSWA